MASRRARRATSLIARADQPLIAIPRDINGQEFVEYFIDEDEADAATTPEDIQAALDLAGAWSDLDWEEMKRELDRIRHESPPTPPIDDL